MGATKKGWWWWWWWYGDWSNNRRKPRGGEDGDGIVMRQKGKGATIKHKRNFKKSVCSLSSLSHPLLQ